QWPSRPTGSGWRPWGMVALSSCGTPPQSRRYWPAASSEKEGLTVLIKQLKALFVGMLILWFSSTALGCQPQETSGKADAPLKVVDAMALFKKTGAAVGDLNREVYKLREDVAY